MAWPMIAAQLLPTLLGGVLSARKSGPKVNPAQLFASLFASQMGQLQGAYAPLMAQVGNMAEARGAALGQDMAGSMGAIGALSSGTGRASYSLGQTAGQALRTQSEVGLRQQMIDQARQNAAALLGPQQGFLEGQRSAGDNFQSWLAQIMSGGQLNTMLGGLLGGQGAPGPGAFQGNGIRPSPGMLPFIPPPRTWGG